MKVKLAGRIAGVGVSPEFLNRAWRGLLGLAFALVLAHCAPVADRSREDDDTAIRFSAQRKAGTVLLTLFNDSRYPVGYNLCKSALERRDAGDWKAVPSEEACTMELRLLKPGDRATFTKTLPAKLVAGEYRYATRIELPSGTEASAVQTAPFSLE